jgi:hypothetical protein
VLSSTQIRQAAQAIRRADHHKLIDLRNSGQGSQRMPQKRQVPEGEPELILPTHAPACARRDDDGSNPHTSVSSRR